MFRFLRNLFRRTEQYNDSILDQIRAGGVSTASTVRVNESTAMNLVAVYSAIRALSEDIASVPFPVYKRLPSGGKDRDRTHPNYRLLNESPDGEISAMQWREFQVKCLNLWGNAYSEIEFNNAGEVIAFHRIEPSKVEPKRTSDGIVYKIDGANELLPASRMLHVAGLGDGLVGLSPIKHARQTIAAGLMMDQFASAWFANGSRGSMALTHPGRLSPDAQKTLRDQLADVHGGPLNAGKFFIFEEGMTAQQLSVPAEEAQFLGSRIFTVQEICRMFRIPCSLLQENSNSAVRANTEQEAINYITHSLRPWMVRIEKEINRKAFREDERETWFAEHLIDAMLRGEAQARTAALKDQFLNGALTHDEWREIENRNPLPDDLGKLHYVPLNMTTVEKMNADEDEEEQPEPVPEDDQSNPEPEDDESSDQNDETPQIAPDSVVESARDALRDVIARMVRRECSAVERASNRPRDFLQSIEEFYVRHCNVVAEAILPTLRTYLAATCADLEYDADDVEAYAIDVAEAICENGKSELLDLSGDVKLNELRPAVENMTQIWAKNRTAEIVRQIAT